MKLSIKFIVYFVLSYYSSDEWVSNLRVNYGLQYREDKEGFNLNYKQLDLFLIEF